MNQSYIAGYRLAEIRPDVWLVCKPDGTEYTVTLTPDWNGARCSCPRGKFHHGNCKHQDYARAAARTAAAVAKAKALPPKATTPPPEPKPKHPPYAEMVPKRRIRTKAQVEFWRRAWPLACAHALEIGDYERFARAAERERTARI